MSLEKPARIKSIKLTLDERVKWESLVFNYFQDLGADTPGFIEFKKEAEQLNVKLSSSPLLDYSKKIVQECENGWPKAPKRFDTRITLKTGWNSPLRQKKAVIKQDKVVEESKKDRESSFLDIRSILTSDEVAFFDKRIKEYVDDFDFNVSSDMPLVERLITEEILHRRLFIMHLQVMSDSKNKSKLDPETISSALSDAHKRMTELQKQLGISRVQRTDEMNRGIESIAELAVSFDEKIKKYPELRKKLLEEEQRFMLEKSLEEPINVIPEPKQLEAMLNNADSSQIYENSVAQTLSNVALKHSELPGIAKKEQLPDGIDLDGG